VGARFGRYELTAQIGAGGMGEVFRARDHDLQRDVAIKFLPARYASDADRLARFAQEARAASGLNHPNIITIHEIGEALGQPYIVMEFVDGRTLRDEIGRAPLSAKRVIEYGAQIAGGLSKAHAAGIVHRDLKPENVMVTNDGFAKILDFGLAKLRSEEAENRGGGLGRASDEDVTRATPATLDGAILGTVGYMSPEQAAGQPAGFQADQFSLGAILYELATGRRAFARNTTVQTLSAILESEPPPLHDVNPSFPAPARWVVERCLAKNPADRYASTVDLAHELRSVREHFAEASSGPGISDRASPKPRRRRVRAGAIVATVLAALVVLLGLLAVPSVNDFVRERLGLLPLPAEKRVAVLPVECRGGTEAERKSCEGMFDFVIARLGEQERFQRALSVVPALEIRQNGVDSADAARGRLGATLAVHITAEQVGDQSLLSASLIDTRRLRQLRAANRHFASSVVSLLDQAVDAVVEVLNLQLDDDAKSALRAGGTNIAAAATLFAQGLQATPYQTARTALEKYDQQRSLEQAIELFNRALELDPNYAHALAGLGEARLRLYKLTRQPEQIPLAEKHCRRALELDNTLGQAWQTLGNLHVQTGKPEEALEELKRALDRRPANAEIYRDIASAYDKLNRPQDAEAAYRKAIELRPGSWSIYGYYGWFLNNKNRYVEAEAAFRQAMQMAPDNARLWSNLGGALYNQGRRDEALQAFERSIAIYPSGAAYSNVGTLRFHKAEYRAAAPAFEAATKLSPRDYRIWRNLGSAYYWAPGERERAAAAYRTAQDLGEQERRVDAKNGRVVIALADCAAMLGDKARSLTLVDEALRLAPDDSEVQYMAGDVYETLGDRDAALGRLDAAFRAGYQRGEIEVSPSFERLRADPRYKTMMAALPAASSKPQ